MSAAFDRMATVTASTKRPPAATNGQRGAAAAYLSNVRCTPLDPLETELRARVGTRAPVEALQCWVDADRDIRAGDYLTVGGVDYPIRAIETWAWRGSTYRVLILEAVKP